MGPRAAEVKGGLPGTTYIRIVIEVENIVLAA